MTVSKTVREGSNPSWDAKNKGSVVELVYGTGLENRRALILPRGFESHRFRQVYVDTADLGSIIEDE